MCIPANMTWRVRVGKTGRYFIAISFRLSFIICYQEGPRNSEITGIKWNTSADVNILGEKTKENTESLLEPSREVGLEVKTDITKCLLMSRHQNEDKIIIYCLIINPSKIWRSSSIWAVANQNYFYEELKSMLNSGNACYHSVQSLLSSRLLFKNFSIKIKKQICLLFWVGMKLGFPR
jgi:hypothetical protein